MIRPSFQTKPAEDDNLIDIKNNLASAIGETRF